MSAGLAYNYATSSLTRTRPYLTSTFSFLPFLSPLLPPSPRSLFSLLSLLCHSNRTPLLISLCFSGTCSAPPEATPWRILMKSKLSLRLVSCVSIFRVTLFGVEVLLVMWVLVLWIAWIVVRSTSLWLLKNGIGWLSGGKKKEVKKETGLGMSFKKDENFGEWYSEVHSSDLCKSGYFWILLLIWVRKFILICAGCYQCWDDWVLWHFRMLHSEALDNGNLGGYASK